MVRAGVIGATGYSGIEAVRLLARHPEAELTYVTSTSEVGTPAARLYPGMHRLGLAFDAFDPDTAKARADVFLLCLPHGQAAAFAAVLLDDAHKVIDLSADFRLQADVYEQWYGQAHAEPVLLETAVYGLPELNGEDIRQARLVANPGCYPTGALLALAPAVAEGLINADTIVVDAKSGVSGAGRSPTAATHFCQVYDSMAPYNVGRHRHTPEIEQSLGELAAHDVVVSFTPHLTPMNRGILTNAYAELSQEVTTARLIEVYRDFYAQSPFVVVYDEGGFPATKDVAGSNDCHIGLLADERTGRLVAISAIDNLVKGAAGQAVQNMNLMYALDEATGLTHLGRTV